VHGVADVSRDHDLAALHPGARHRQFADVGPAHRMSLTGGTVPSRYRLAGVLTGSRPASAMPTERTCVTPTLAKFRYARGPR
jgi:hypothetical protein